MEELAYIDGFPLAHLLSFGHPDMLLYLPPWPHVFLTIGRTKIDTVQIIVNCSLWFSTTPVAAEIAKLAECFGKYTHTNLIKVNTDTTSPTTNNAIWKTVEDVTSTGINVSVSR